MTRCVLESPRDASASLTSASTARVKFGFVKEKEFHEWIRQFRETDGSAQPLSPISY